MIKSTGEVQAAAGETREKSPLVSILCRTMNRPELDTAIQSAINQTYEPLEILLVDATGKKEILSRSLPERTNIRLLTPDEALDRPRAANFALDHANGELLLFLDEDDWIAADHVKLLVELLNQDTAKLAAYSATQKVDAEGKPLDVFFNHAFDRILLQRDNYIPIHSVLFSRKLIGLGCRFDESLAIYEDWDFWLQCARHTDFNYLDKTTAFYRQGGESNTSPSSESSKYDSTNQLGAMRAKIFEKLLSTWSGKDINAILGSMDQSEYIGSLNEHVTSLNEHIASLNEHIASLNEQIASLGRVIDRLDTDNGKLLSDLNKVSEELHHVVQAAQSAEEKLKIELEAQQSRNEELNKSLHTLFHSSSWRITKPCRWIGHRLKLFVLFPLQKLLSRR
jgi:glycosyltransferase involved in cell wall biosynthesis